MYRLSPDMEKRRTLRPEYLHRKNIVVYKVIFTHDIFQPEHNFLDIVFISITQYFHTMNKTKLKRKLVNVGKRLLQYDVPKAEHFWEYYNRCTFVVNKVATFTPEKPTVLDVGGATGRLLPKFGISNVTVVDFLPGADFIGSGASLPVKDNSFDIVTAIDVFEHIPVADRTTVLLEMLRVAKKMVIIIAPQNTPLNVKAEEIVSRFYPHAWLLEHAEHGLVDFSDLETAVKKVKHTRYEISELDNLMNWASMFLTNIIHVCDAYQELYFLENHTAFRRKALTITL